MTDRLNIEARYGLDPSIFSMLKQLSTVFLIILGFIFLKEEIVLKKVIGSMLIIISNVMLAFDKGKFKLNKYFTLQSRAAAIGKFIHETGSVSRAKVMLNKVIAEPNKISGAGRDTVVYRYTPSVEVAEVNGMFLSLMSEHRNLNAQLNNIKADAIEEANKQNIANEQEYQKARTAYSKEYNDWLDKIEDLQSRFNQYIITEKEKISKLKINVPDSLMETYKSIKALLAE